MFFSFYIVCSFTKCICPFPLSKGKISLGNPYSRSRIYNRCNHCNDNQYYYTGIIYSMFISCTNLILTRYQQTLPCRRAACSVASPQASPGLGCAALFRAAARFWLSSNSHVTEDVAYAISLPLWAVHRFTGDSGSQLWRLRKRLLT